MINRRRFSRARTIVPRRRHWLWIRQNFNSTAAILPSAFNQLDLLGSYRAAAGVDLNLPEFTIWRFRIKVSIRFNVAPATSYVSNDGVLIAAFCDDKNDPGSHPATSIYEEKFLIWHVIYAFEAIAQGANGGSLDGANSIALYHDFDVKSHRRLDNIGDSLIFQIAPVGLDGNVLDYSIQTTILGLLRN